MARHYTLCPYHMFRHFKCAYIHCTRNDGFAGLKYSLCDILYAANDKARNDEQKCHRSSLYESASGSESKPTPIKLAVALKSCQIIQRRVGEVQALGMRSRKDCSMPVRLSRLTDSDSCMPVSHCSSTSSTCSSSRKAQFARAR